MNTFKLILIRISIVMGLPLQAVVYLYQHTLSPDHGLLKGMFPDGYCRFYPSCSQYTMDGLQETGVLAIPRIVWRIVRCQPWSLGGVDHFRKQHVANNIR